MASNGVTFDRRTAERMIAAMKKVERTPASQVGRRPTFVGSYVPANGSLEIGYVTGVVDLGGGVWAYDADGPTMAAVEQIPRDRLVLPGVSYTPLEEEDPVLLARVTIDDVETIVIWSAQEVRGTAACEEGDPEP